MAATNTASLDVRPCARLNSVSAKEAPAMMLITILLSIGLVSVYSASAVLAQVTDC